MLNGDFQIIGNFHQSLNNDGMIRRSVRERRAFAEFNFSLFIMIDPGAVGGVSHIEDNTHWS